MDEPKSELDRDWMQSVRELMDAYFRFACSLFWFQVLTWVIAVIALVVSITD